MITSIVQSQYNELLSLVSSCAPLLEKVGIISGNILHSLKSGGKIITAGNGGSATDAMHMTEEFIGRYKTNRRPLPSICLASDTSTLTCIANDFGFDQVFARQLEALGQPNDLLVLFSTSGNSLNLIKALEVAKQKRIFTVALLGRDGGKLKGCADLELIVPHDQSARIQEIHAWIMHVILEVVEQSKLDN